MMYLAQVADEQMATVLSNINLLEQEATGLDNQVVDVKGELPVGEVDVKAAWDGQRIIIKD